MPNYTKLKCAMCNNEMSSKAKKPKCSKCGSRKLNALDNFSMQTPKPTTPAPEAQQQAAPAPKPDEQQQAPAEEKPAKNEVNDWFNS